MRRPERAAPLGDLERLVMGVLWEKGDGLTVRQVAEHFPDHAYTTVMTVLERLDRKGLVKRSRAGRANVYRASGTREQYAAALMMDALDSTPDTAGALVHFAQSVTHDEARLLRQILDGQDEDPAAS